MICSSGLKKEPCEPFSDSTPMISNGIPRIWSSWPIIAAGFVLNMSGMAEPSTA